MLGCRGGELANRTVRLASPGRASGGGGVDALRRTVLVSAGGWFLVNAEMGGSSSLSEAEDMSSYIWFQDTARLGGNELGVGG